MPAGRFVKVGSDLLQRYLSAGNTFEINNSVKKWQGPFPITLNESVL